jgi:hypothetical protein
LRLRSSLLLGLAVCAASAQAAQAAPFTLEASGSNSSRGKVRAIGGFHPQRDPTLGAATSVFGQPSKVSQTSNASCRVLWRSVGVRIAFVNLGGGSPCDPALTKAQVVRVFDPRWRTGRGLSIGNGLRRLRRLYPGATRHGKSFWLVRAVNIFVGGSPYPVLRATMRNGRVASFALDVGAGGE